MHFNIAPMFSQLSIFAAIDSEVLTKTTSPIPLLSLLIFTPIIGAILLAILPRKFDANLTRVLGLAFSLSTMLFGLAAACIVLGCFETDPMQTGKSFEGLTQNAPWIPGLGANYHLKVDGLSIILVLLTGIISPISLLASWKLDRPQLFNALFLLLQGSALGVFLSMNFIPWFLFWELSLFPAFFLIKLWGGPNATKAAYQFIIYTMVGSAFMLLAFAAIYAVLHTIPMQEGRSCLDFNVLAAIGGLETVRDPNTGAILFASLNVRLAEFGSAVPMLVFFGVLLGLAVKVPMFPFHTWLPATYAAAPTGVAMMLTAILSKMGVYSIHRILWPIFNEQLHITAPWLIWLAVAGIVFGAYAAIRQTDLKRMIAYSSINHLGYCLLAVFSFFSMHSSTTPPSAVSAPVAYTGTLLQMFNHGLSAAALFFCIGILESRAGTRGLHDFGGVRKVAPVFAALCGISLFSSLGLPGLNGFVGEFLIFRGTFAMTPWPTAISCLGLLGTAIFLLTFWQKVFHGPPGPNTAKVTDLTLREILVLVPLALLMLTLGVWPQLLINLTVRQ